MQTLATAQWPGPGTPEISLPWLIPALSLEGGSFLPDVLAILGRQWRVPVPGQSHPNCSPRDKVIWRPDLWLKLRVHWPQIRLTGASLTLPTCCLGTSSPGLGSGVPDPEGRGFGGVLSWWVGCILLRQRGPHRTPAPSGPALSGGESTGSRDEQSFFRILPLKPARALRRHQRPSHPFHPCSRPQGLHHCCSL